MRKIPNPKFQIPNSKFQITNSQTNFCETVSRLPSLSLFSTSLLMTNDQWPRTNYHSQPYFSWSWKIKPPSSPRTAKWEKSQIPNSKSQIAKPISAKLSPVPFLSLFSQPIYQWLMTNDLSQSFFSTSFLFSRPLY